MFECTQGAFKRTKKTLLQKHRKSFHGEDKLQEGLKKEFLTDDDDMAMEEYFETNVKNDIELDY